MAEARRPLRYHFRTPDRQLLLYSASEDAVVSHALLAKDEESERWSIIGVFDTSAAAAKELAHRTIKAPMTECLIIECEPY
jgi:hypothetical protein